MSLLDLVSKLYRAGLEVDPRIRESISSQMNVIFLTWMYQFLFRSECRPSLSVISAAFIALGKS